MWSGTVDSAKAWRALLGWAAFMAPEMALRTAIARRGWEMSGAMRNAVQCWRAVPENGINVSDPGSSDRPALGTGISSTALSLVSLELLDSARGFGSTVA